MNKAENYFVTTIFFIIITFIFLSIYNTNAPDEKIRFKEIKTKEGIHQTSEEKQNQKFTNEETSSQNDTKIRIPINPATPLSYKSKKEILENRIHFVMNSIFRNENYLPSEEVFGQIEDNKPWISNKLCIYKDNNQSDTEGPSEEARYINNPEVLVAIEYAFYGQTCRKHDPYFINSQFPIRIIYDKEKREIINEYTYLPYCNSKGTTWYHFKGLNARDLGYKYAYLDLEKSTFKPHFKEEINISNSIVEFQDFIHVGGSCGVSGGCNNASPNQPVLNFSYPCTDENGIYAQKRTLYIKLWKERPQSPEQKADITQKIIIRRLKLPSGE